MGSDEVSKMGGEWPQGRVGHWASWTMVGGEVGGGKVGGNQVIGGQMGDG